MDPQFRILMIDDDEIDVMSTRRALEELGASNPLDHVWNGEEALTFLSDHAERLPDLILLDLNMPRMDGMELLAIVKANPSLNTIPVVVLTTSQEKADRTRSFNQCASGYMVKPIDYRQFVEMIDIIHAYWTLSETANNEEPSRSR